MMEPALISISIVGALGAFVLYLIYRALQELHLTMNSRLDELVNTTKLLARAEGFEAGRKNHIDQIKVAGDAVKP